MPKGIAKAILNSADDDGDRRLDFEEFFRLSQQHSWLVRDMCVKYCRYVVPRRDGGIGDETGEFKMIKVFVACTHICGWTLLK